MGKIGFTKIVGLIIAFVCFCPLLKGQTQPYVVVFDDKPHYQVSQQVTYLSARAYAKRLKYQKPISKSDCPIFQPYVDTVLQTITADTLLATSKWFNLLVAKMDSMEATAVQSLPFVTQCCLLSDFDCSSLLLPEDTASVQIPKFSSIMDISYPQQEDTAYYGAMYEQIHINKGDLLHQQGFYGTNMLVVVLDGGYIGLDTMSFFDSWRNQHLLASNNFTDEPYIYRGTGHGRAVLSIMAANNPYQAVGSCPNADYVIVKTECNDYEALLEEFFLVEGLEFADSVGADAVNISLGYTEFDNSEENHTYQDLNGISTIASVAASRLARLTTIVCIAAGNSGNLPWHYFGTPADALHAITVGAVDKEAHRSYLSSFGGHLDMTIHKPDVMAVGQETAYIEPSNEVNRGDGTSFASPIITGLATCLWQAYRQYDPQTIKAAIIQSATQYPIWLDSMGYGIADFWKAYLLLADLSVQNNESTDFITIYPNPTTGVFQIETFEPYVLQLYNTMGQLIRLSNHGAGLNRFDFSDLAQGIYVVKITINGRSYSKKIKID